MKDLILHKKNSWILLGLLTLLLGKLMPPAVVEQVYSRSIFVAIRWGFTVLGSWVSIPLVYLLLLVLAGWLGWKWRSRSTEKRPWPRKLLRWGHSLLAFAGGILFLFQILWGFNYGRIPLEAQFGISPKPLAISELKAELETVTAEAARLRSQLDGATDSVLPARLMPAEVESVMRSHLEAVLEQHGYPTPGKVRGRQLWPKGVLLRISTAGVYIPFTGEGHVDAGLHFLQKPFVLAHEMSHGYGFGDEGSCNFLAYLACVSSDDLFVQYVGQLYYWRYVAAEYRSANPDDYAVFRETLPTGLRSDVRAIQAEMDKYPDIFPEIRDATYNAYLQAQGIAEGMKNYDRVVMLVTAWRNRR